VVTVTTVTPVTTAAMATVTTVTPVTTAAVLLTTTAADGNASLTSIPGCDDHAGRESRGVEQNDWSAPHLG
jgi:hypothetical protein